MHYGGSFSTSVALGPALHGDKSMWCIQRLCRGGWKLAITCSCTHKVTINAVRMTYCNHRTAIVVHSETKLPAPNSFQLFGTVIDFTVSWTLLSVSLCSCSNVFTDLWDNVDTFTIIYYMSSVILLAVIKSIDLSCSKRIDLSCLCCEPLSLNVWRADQPRVTDDHYILVLWESMRIYENLWKWSHFLGNVSFDV